MDHDAFDTDLAADLHRRFGGGDASSGAASEASRTSRAASRATSRAASRASSGASRASRATSEAVSEASEASGASSGAVSEASEAGSDLDSEASAGLQRHERLLCSLQGRVAGLTIAQSYTERHMMWNTMAWVALLGYILVTHMT